MLALLDQTKDTIAPSDEDALIAREAVSRLDALVNAGQDIRITVQEQPNIVVPLPAIAVGYIFEVLKAIAEKTPVSVIPFDAKLTTQQAADYLNVSRQHLVNQLQGGALPFEKVGTHRRIRFADLLDYEVQGRHRAREALAEMADLARDLDLE